MAEMNLYIKPVFDKSSVDEFARDVQNKVGSSSSRGGQVLSSSGGSVSKEMSQQTELLSGINKFTKVLAVGAVAGGLFNAPGIIAGAIGEVSGIGQGLQNLSSQLAQPLGPLRSASENRLFSSVTQGASINTDVAARLATGSNIQEALRGYEEEVLLNEQIDNLMTKKSLELALQNARQENNTELIQKYSSELDKVNSDMVFIRDLWSEFAEQGRFGARSMLDIDSAAKNIIDTTPNILGDMVKIDSESASLLYSMGLWNTNLSAAKDYMGDIELSTGRLTGSFLLDAVRLSGELKNNFGGVREDIESAVNSIRSIGQGISKAVRSIKSVVS